jgi:hypothetical protein
MRRLAIGTAAGAIGAAVLTLAAFGAGSAPKPSLRIQRMAPLEVSGAHFRSHEHVRVTAVIGETKKVNRLRASGSGAFRTTFPIGAGRCSSVRVVAISGSGSRATVKRLPAPACLPV